MMEMTIEWQASREESNPAAAVKRKEKKITEINEPLVVLAAKEVTHKLGHRLVAASICGGGERPKKY